MLGLANLSRFRWPAAITIVLATTWSTTCAQTPAAEPSLAPYVRQVLADLADHARFHHLTWSSQVIRQRIEFVTALQQQLEAELARRGELSPSAAIDATLLQGRLASEQNDLQLRQRRRAEMDSLIPFAEASFALERNRAARAPLSAQAAATTLSQIAEQAKAVTQRLEAKPDPARTEPTTTEKNPVVAWRSAKAIDLCRAAHNSWAEHHRGFNPEFDFWCAAPLAAADEALGKLGAHLREQIAQQRGAPDDPLVGDPIGAEALTNALRTERIALTSTELLALAEEQTQWCHTELKRAAAELGLGDDWPAALEQAKNSAEPIGQQADFVARIAQEATDFVTSRSLVTVPPLAAALWRTDMLSPQRQRTLPFAAYGGQCMLVAFPHAGMSHPDKLMAQRSNNRHGTRLVVPHELIPGHHLQAFMSQRYQEHRRGFSTPFYVEGWALYWEMKLWDLNWASTPLDKVGMLFWRLHRAARITVSLKFHLGQMQPQEMVEYLVTTVGHERATASAEVRRFIGDDYGPLYQVGYLTGGVQLRALWNEMVTTGGMTELEFNDRVLKTGPIPIDLVRHELQGTVPQRDATWRFGR